MGNKMEKEAKSTDTVEENGTLTEIETTETIEETPIGQDKVKKKTSSYHANCANTGGPSWDWKKERKSSRSKSGDSKKSGNVSSPDSSKMSNDDSPKDEVKKKTSSFHANCTNRGGPSPRKSEKKSSRSTSSGSNKSGNVSSPESGKMSSDDSPKDEMEIKKKTSSFHENCTKTVGPSSDWKNERKSSRSVSSDSKKSENVSSPDSEKMDSNESPKDDKGIKKKTSSYHTNCTNYDGHHPNLETERKSSTSTREDSKKSGHFSSPDSKNENQDDSPKDENKIEKETSSSHGSDATSQSDTNKNTSKKMNAVTGKKKSNQVTDKNNQDNKPFPNPQKSGGNIDGFVPKPPSTVKYSRSCNCVRNSSCTASKSTENQNQAASKTTKKKNQVGSKETGNQNKVAPNTTEKQKEAASKTIEKEDEAVSKTTEKQNQDVKPFPSPKENDTTSDDVQGTEPINNPQDDPKIDGNPF